MLHYVEQGRGPAILFVHAFPLDHTMWQLQVDFFATRYRVVTPDLRGFGGSQPPRPWSIEQMGEELLTLLDQLQIENCILVGLSIGGYIALPFAVNHHERVKKLVLAHTRARADNETERQSRTAMVDALQQNGIVTLPD